MNREILNELARRTQRLESWRSEVLISADIRRQRQYGPDYCRRTWFGPCDEARRKAIQRAITRLEKKGLITTHSRGERRISNLKLTEAGRAKLKGKVKKWSHSETT